MNVCAGCGTIALEGRGRCEVCDSSERTQAPTPGKSGYFVGVRCRFQCRGCGRLAPVDTVALRDVVRCPLCGLTQAFAPSSWPAAFAHAHAVGDLAGGEGLHPSRTWVLGKTNPFREVTVRRATATEQLDGVERAGGVEVPRNLQVQAGLGHPVCASCHVALDIRLPAMGGAEARCPECGATTTYESPPGALDSCRGLRAVLAPEARLATQTTKDGLTALSCPGCGAPLRIGKGARTATCDFCRLVCRLPSGDAPIDDASPNPETIWLSFSGPSARRAQLERGPSEGARPIGQLQPTKPGKIGFFLGLVPTAVVAGGVTGAVGVVLFLLMRMGVVS